MAAINDYLSSLRDSSYSWKNSDCLTAISGFLELQEKSVPDYSEFHSFDEESDAVHYSYKTYRTMLRAHEVVFNKAGLLITNGCWKSGDLLLFRHPFSKFVHVGFISESCEILTYCPDGLNYVKASDIKILRIIR